MSRRIEIEVLFGGWIHRLSAIQNRFRSMFVLNSLIHGILIAPGYYTTWNNFHRLEFFHEDPASPERRARLRQWEEDNSPYVSFFNFRRFGEDDDGDAPTPPPKEAVKKRKRTKVPLCVGNPYLHEVANCVGRIRLGKDAVLTLNEEELTLQISFQAWPHKMTLRTESVDELQRWHSEIHGGLQIGCLGEGEAPQDDKASSRYARLTDSSSVGVFRDDAFCWFSEGEFVGEGQKHVPDSPGLDWFAFEEILRYPRYSGSNAIHVRLCSTSETYFMREIFDGNLDRGSEEENFDLKSAMRKHLGILSHPHPLVATIRYVYKLKGKLILVFHPYFDGEKLSDELEDGGFGIDRARKYFADIVLGLEHLHNCGIVMERFLVEDFRLTLDDRVVLEDYHFEDQLLGSHLRIDNFIACDLDDDKPIPPELFAKEYRVDRSMDLWSLGWILYKMISGKPPFGLIEDLYDSVRRCQLKFEEKDEDGRCCFDQDSIDLLRRLLVVEPEKRIQIDEIKQHPFLESISWESLVHCEEVFSLNDAERFSFLLSRVGSFLVVEPRRSVICVQVSRFAAFLRAL